MKRILLIILIIGIAILSLVFLFGSKTSAPATITESSSSDRAPAATAHAFDKAKYPLEEPGSLWWIVNKSRALPDDYMPPDLGVPSVRLRLGRTAEQMQLSQQAIPAVESMFSAAKADNVTLVFGSGYRSYALQKQFYDSYVAQDGQAAADRYSARPGTSEHQTGLSFDVTNVGEACHLEICFQDTPEGKWVLANAHTYGFIVRYPSGKEAVTGYQYEPWHLRYVGPELAVELHRSGQTMEEFFGLSN